MNYDTLENISLKDYRMEYKEFLKTTLPHLGLRWRRFRGKSIRKRIIGRLQELNLQSWSQYGSHLLENQEERDYLTGLLTVTISRFWRNAQLFKDLEKTWLPRLLERLPAGERQPVSRCRSGRQAVPVEKNHTACSYCGRKILLIRAMTCGCWPVTWIRGACKEPCGAAIRPAASGRCLGISGKNTVPTRVGPSVFPQTSPSGLSGLSTI